ncbi:11335_t:CDS:2, partial [Acaulospora morrowiae]
MYVIFFTVGVFYVFLFSACVRVKAVQEEEIPQDKSTIQPTEKIESTESQDDYSINVEEKLNADELYRAA